MYSSTRACFQATNQHTLFLKDTEIVNVTETMIARETVTGTGIETATEIVIEIGTETGIETTTETEEETEEDAGVMMRIVMAANLHAEDFLGEQPLHHPHLLCRIQHLVIKPRISRE